VVRILRVFEQNTSNVSIFFVFTTNQFLQVLNQVVAGWNKYPRCEKGWG